MPSTLAPRCHRELYRIDADASHRHVAVHVPRHRCGRRVVICPPLGEEHARARRVLYGIGARLAAVGHAAIVYDGFGHGDSEGEFADVTVDRLVSDLATMARHPALEGTADVVVGVRFGAAVAAEAVAQKSIAPAQLVLVEPILCGAAYARELLCQNVASQTATLGRARKDARALEADLAFLRAVDIDGHAMQGPLFEGIVRCDGVSALARCATPVDVIVVRSVASPRPPPDALALAHARGGVAVQTIDDHAFWRSNPHYVVTEANRVADAVAELVAPPDEMRT